MPTRNFYVADKVKICACFHSIKEAREYVSAGDNRGFPEFRRLESKSLLYIPSADQKKAGQCSYTIGTREALIDEGFEDQLNEWIESKRNESQEKIIRKLSSEDIEDVIKKLEEGKTGQNIAKEYSISPAMVSKIRKGKIKSKVKEAREYSNDTFSFSIIVEYDHYASKQIEKEAFDELLHLFETIKKVIEENEE